MLLNYGFLHIYIPKRGIAGWYDSSNFIVLRILHTALHSDCTNLCSHQQWRRVPFSSHSLQHSLFVVIFFNKCILFNNCFIYFWLCCVFATGCGFSLVMACGGYCLLLWLLLLWSAVSRCQQLCLADQRGLVFVAHGLSCSIAYGFSRSSDRTAVACIAKQTSSH